MPENKSRFDRAISFAYSEARRVSNIAALPERVRTVIMVDAAQGVIDNGGLQYFFEMDFPDKPPYSDFINAYRRIGAVDAAAAMERAVALFPLKEPHLHVSKRNKFMDSFKNKEGDEINSPFTPLTDLLCGNKNVWRQLEAFIERNAKQLGV